MCKIYFIEQAAKAGRFTPAQMHDTQIVVGLRAIDGDNCPFVYAALIKERHERVNRLVVDLGILAQQARTPNSNVPRLYEQYRRIKARLQILAPNHPALAKGLFGGIMHGNPVAAG